MKVMNPYASPIYAEWYRSHRPNKPEIVEREYLRGFGEFSVGYDRAFEKHLKEIQPKRVKD